MIIGWLYILLASVAEMIGILGLSLYSNKRNLLNIILYYIGIGGSFFLVYQAINYLPVSVAYTVYTGFGTASAILINILFFQESKNWLRLCCLGMIIFGVCGLKMIQ